MIWITSSADSRMPSARARASTSPAVAATCGVAAEVPSNSS
jgi:hypothetical protein